MLSIIVPQAPGFLSLPREGERGTPADQVLPFKSINIKVYKVAKFTESKFIKWKSLQAMAKKMLKFIMVSLSGCFGIEVVEDDQGVKACSEGMQGRHAGKEGREGMQGRACREGMQGKHSGKACREGMQ